MTHGQHTGATAKTRDLFHLEISSSLGEELQFPPCTNGAAEPQGWQIAPGKQQQDVSSYLVKIQNKTNTA